MGNPAAEKLLDYTGSELQKLSFTDLFPPDKRTEAVSFINQIDQDKVNICSIPPITQNRKKIPAEIRMVSGEWDSTQAYIVIAHDITEKIEASRLLDKSEACWHFVLESFGDGMWDYNIKTGELKYSKPEYPVEVRHTKDDKYAIIEVADKGIGIPEQDKNAVFDPFRRGSNVEGIYGTGLGLAISKKFIKALEGKMYFESKLHGGTTFFVLLPGREGQGGM